MFETRQHLNCIADHLMPGPSIEVCDEAHAATVVLEFRAVQASANIRPGYSVIPVVGILSCHPATRRKAVLW